MSARATPLWQRLAVGTLGLAALSVLAGVAFSASRVAEAARGRVYDVANVPAREVGMVLGARAYPTRPSTILAARLDVALQLYHTGKIRTVLVTGDGLARSHHETAVMRDYLLERGVPPDRVVEDPGGFDTYDSCVRAREVHGVREMIVISQAFHVPRAIMISRARGIDAIGVADQAIRHRSPVTYRKGQLRELLANLKMEWDLLSRRRPQHPG